MPQQPESSTVKSVPSKHLFVGAHPDHGFVVAVPVNEDRSMERRKPVVGFVDQELAEQEGLLLQPASVRVVGEEVDELVPERGETARFLSDQRSAGADMRSERIQDASEQSLRRGQHAVVGTAAGRNTRSREGSGPDIRHPPEP